MSPYEPRSVSKPWRDSRALDLEQHLLDLHCAVCARKTLKINTQDFTVYYAASSRRGVSTTDVGCQDYLCYTFSTFLMKRTCAFANFGLVKLIY